MPYLTELTIRLAEGVARLTPDEQTWHADYFLRQQRPDGGFAGREGGSDLYYTSFGLRSLALLGQLQGEVAARAAEFLRGRLTGQAPIVDFLALIYGATLVDLSAGIDVFADRPAAWREQVVAALEALRRDDGGYAKSPDGAASSTYHTFLVALCYELLERPLVDPARMAAFVVSQRREDGGFVEIRPMRRGGANPTAAAIGLLRITGALTDDVRDAACDFLADMKTDEGGLRANTRIPIADLLSTFTGALTLADLGGLDRINVAAVIQYAQSLTQPEGGYLGAVWDQLTDVEYSFYGLATRALLTPQSPAPNP